MLPDYPAIKQFACAALLRRVKSQIPHEEPVLSGIHHSTIHEGRAASLTRADSSSADITFKTSSAEISIPREQMRRTSVDELLRHMTDMARQLAEHQARTMFAEIGQAADEVGNTVSANELGDKDAFLEIERKIAREFDPVTLQPKDLVVVMHPSQVERLKKLASEWENDAAFKAERERIRQQKLEEWRARENRRQLVD